MKGSGLADVELAVAECINWFNRRRLHDEKHYPEKAVSTGAGS